MINQSQNFHEQKIASNDIPEILFESKKRSVNQETNLDIFNF